MLEGHVLVGRPKNQAAFVLPNIVADDLVWQRKCCPEFAHVTRTTAVVLGASGIITCFFPHCAKANPWFFNFLVEANSILTYMRVKPEIKYICCVVTSTFRFRETLIAWRVTCLTARLVPIWKRANLLSSICCVAIGCALRPRWENSNFRRFVTLVFLGRLRWKESYVSQIDYICIYDNFVCEDINIKRGRRIKSNHIPVSGSFLVPDGEWIHSILFNAQIICRL